MPAFIVVTLDDAMVLVAGLASLALVAVRVPGVARGAGFRALALGRFVD
jgi:hypothetical protein